VVVQIPHVSKVTGSNDAKVTFEHEGFTVEQSKPSVKAFRPGLTFNQTNNLRKNPDKLAN